MFKTIKEKSYLLGYIIIMYGISRLGYICFYFTHDIFNNTEQTVIESKSITIIGETHFNYINIIFVICFYLILIFLGIYIIKRQNKKKINNTI